MLEIPFQRVRQAVCNGFHTTLSVCFLLALSPAVHAAPVVSNIVGSQRTDGSKRVDITYDVAGAANKSLVSVVLSNNNGTNWNVIPTPSTLSGDLGAGISNGTGKHIVWEAGIDRPNIYWPQTKVQVTAADIGSTLTIMLPGGVPLVMVRIPGGTFMMGSALDPGYTNSTETPLHQVTISNDFYLGMFEVTQKQWYAVMNANPASFSTDANNPVEQVSWNDSQAFITALNTLGQGTFRLPSEAEWEYACRAGTTTRWYFGDDPAQLSNYAWYNGNASSHTHPVGGKLPNPFGLYDMHGNVFELVQDWYHSSYSGAPADGSAWVSPVGTSRTSHGGSWNYNAAYNRSAIRGVCAPDSRTNDLGLRLVRN